MNKRNEHIRPFPKAVGFTESTIANILYVVPGKAIDKNQYERVEQLVNNIIGDFESADLLRDDIASKGFFRSIPSAVLNSDIFKALLLAKQFCQKIINYDAVHIFQLDGSRFFQDVLPFIVLSKFFGKKVIFDNRNRSSFDRWHRMNYFFKRSLKMVDGVLVLSDYQKQAVSEIGKSSEYVPFVIDIDKYKTRVIEQVQPKILISISEPKYHNPFCVIKAYEQVKQKYPRTELLFCGPVEYRSYYKDIPGLTFCEASEISKVMNEADVFVNSTRYDFMEPTILEAMACGLPVISSPISLIGRLENRSNILFFRYNDHNGLTDALLELVENKQLTEQLSQAGNQTAKEYDWQNLKQKWLSVYSKLNS